MTRPRLFLVGGILLLVVLLGVGFGVWQYLFGANEVEAAELVPANTVLFATIPNAASIALGYQTSHLKTLVDSPGSKPIRDSLANLIGEKNLELLNAFLPNLSGQSFIAVTHFDADHPEKMGFIAGMKPKAGLGDFDAFIEKLKATWPDVLKQGTTGNGSVLGVDYQWIQGPGAPEKICVARVRGWIITSLGEASLQDWIERYRKKPTTSSLAEDVNYRKALAEVGDKPMTLAYVNNQALVDILRTQAMKTDPALGDYLAQKVAPLGGLAIGTRFEDGAIVDRISVLVPRPALIDAGMSAQPCPFETLKFAGPETLFYWAASVDWKQLYKHLKEQMPPAGASAPGDAPMQGIFSYLHAWVHDSGLDTQKNIVNALGSEISVQMEWSPDATYPEVGLFVKLDSPDDFKPTTAAIVESVRKAFINSAVVKELSSDGQNFACLQFVQASAFTPTITEDGPYLGIFLTANQAVRSYHRDQSIGLAHRAEFTRQIGDKKNEAAEIFFLDSPHFLDRGYQTLMPYISIAEMFDKNLAAMLKGQALPADLTWLAPIGAWSCVVTSDEDGLEGYSVSGIGNQGVLFGGAIGGTTTVLQGMGLLPSMRTLKSFLPAAPSPTATSPAPSPPVVPPVPPAAPNPSSTPVEPSAGMTNAAPETTTPSSNAPPAVPAAVSPTTNAIPTTPTPAQAQ